MPITVPTRGQGDWDVPLNAALNTLQTEIDTGDFNSSVYTDTQIVAEITRANNTYLTKLNNLSDLSNVPAARATLGLGNSATRNVGTTAGTVAAGDDSRLTHAVTSVAGRTGDVTLVESDIAGLPADLAARALDATVVHRAGTETITGAKTFSIAPVVPSNSFPETAVTNLVSDLATKAVDSTVVHLNGAETILGQKTFSQPPVVPTDAFPETAVANLTTDLAAKAVDTTVVHLVGTETITGAKTFSIAPVVPNNSFSEAAISGLTADLAARPLDTAVVHNTGAESIDGVKTFTSSPIVPSNSFPESAITNLTSDLAAKVPNSRQVISGTGLAGGGDLTADRTLSVTYGTIAGTAAQGNDSRIVNAIQPGTLFLNVKDFGATGNGTTVDSTAFQNAINAASTAGGGTVYVPQGTYVINAVYLASNVALVGAGMGASVLLLNPASTPGTDAIVIRVANGSTTAASYVTVRDLTIDGNKSVFSNPTNKVYGYYLGTNTLGLVTDCVVSRVEFRNCPTYALDIVNALRVAVTDCFSHDNGGTLGSFNNCSGFEVLGDDIVLENCRAVNNANKGFIAGESGVPHKRIRMVGCTAQSNSSDGFNFHDGVTDSGIVACNSRDNLNAGINISSSSIRNSIIGNTLTGNANNGIRLDNTTYAIVSNNICDANATASSGNPELYLVTGSNHNLVANNIVNSVTSSTSIVEHDTADFNTFRSNIFNKTFTILGANSTTVDSSVVTQVNGHTPTAGAVTLNAADVGAITQATADTRYSFLTEVVNTVASSGATQTIPAVTVSTISDITLSNNCTFTFPTATAGTSFTLVIRQDGTGGRTATFPAGTKWASAIAPTVTSTASAVDVFTFLCVNGVAWMGFTGGQDMR